MTLYNVVVTYIALNLFLAHLTSNAMSTPPVKHPFLYALFDAAVFTPFLLYALIVGMEER